MLTTKLNKLSPSLFIALKEITAVSSNRTGTGGTGAFIFINNAIHTEVKVG